MFANTEVSYSRIRDAKLRMNHIILQMKNTMVLPPMLSIKKMFNFVK